MATPHANVDPPPVVPPRYGLFAAATVLTDEGRWQLAGVQYQSDACATGGIWEGHACNPPPTDPRNITVDVTAAGDGTSPSQLTAQATVDTGPPRDLTVKVGGNPPAAVTTGAGSVAAGTTPVVKRVVTVDLAASGDGDNPSNVTATATVDGGPERDVSVKVADNAATTVTTGDPATQVGTVPVLKHTITVDVTADNAGALTATATVDGGDPRDIAVKVGDNPETTVTTGGGATDVGTVPGDQDGSYPVTVTDAASGASNSGTLDVAANNGGTTQVQVTVAADTTYPVTVTDAASGTSNNGTLPVNADGSGTAQVEVTFNVAADYPVTVTDVATGTTETGTLTVAAGGDGSTRIVLNTEDAETKTVPHGVPIIESSPPFAVYAGVHCPAVALGDAPQRARRRLSYVEQRLVEQRFWNVDLAGGDPTVLNETDGNGNPTPVSLTHAVGLLEDALGDRYAGIGTIHADRLTAAYAQHDDLTRREGPLLRTDLDTAWAFGVGYPGTGPDGVPPTDVNHTWLYATGHVVVYRGEAFVPATERTGAFNPRTNQIHVVAERVYVTTADCPLVAVLVDLGKERT